MFAPPKMALQEPLESCRGILGPQGLCVDLLLDRPRGTRRTRVRSACGRCSSSRKVRWNWSNMEQSRAISRAELQTDLSNIWQNQDFSYLQLLFSCCWHWFFGQIAENPRFGGMKRSSFLLIKPCLDRKSAVASGNKTVKWTSSFCASHGALCPAVCKVAKEWVAGRC